MLTDITDQILSVRLAASSDKLCHLLQASEKGNITFEYSKEDDTMRLSILEPNGGNRLMKIGSYIASFNGITHIVPKNRAEFSFILKEALSHTISGQFTFQADGLESGLHWYRANYSSVADSGGVIAHIIGGITNFDRYMEEYGKIMSRGRIDTLTGLLNTDAARAVIGEVMLDRPAERFDAMLCIRADVCEGESNNVPCDDGIKLMGEVLRRTFRSSDITARMGANEFIVYMRSAGSINIVRNAAERLTRALRAGNAAVCGEMFCHIGISTVSGSTLSFDDVYQHAVEAMRSINSNGENCCAVFNTEQSGSDIFQSGRGNSDE